MKKHLILYGLKSAGKTTLGSHLATLLQRPWFDTDNAIETYYEAMHGEKLSFSEIYATIGEPAFRALEREVCFFLASQTNASVISVGGSVMLNDELVSYLRERGTLIYLDASEDLLWQRWQTNPPRFTNALPLQAAFSDYCQTRLSRYAQLAQHRLVISKDTSLHTLGKLLLSQLNKLDASTLGKKTDYPQTYNADCLYPIERQQKREEIGINSSTLPFFGFDCWNHYEVSWLNQKGKPLVATAEIYYDCNSDHMIESKSLKLYFNSFNNVSFQSNTALENLIKRDLEKVINAPVHVTLHPITPENPLSQIYNPPGIYIDDLDVTCTAYNVSPHYLTTAKAAVTETLCSHLLKSNCLVTHQPDWASIQITYKGPQIDRAGLLRYLVSYRNHNEFHEQCIERIFIDILHHCKPSELTIYGRYTRRGGLDINPYRSTKPIKRIDFKGKNTRFLRQ